MSSEIDHRALPDFRFRRHDPTEEWSGFRTFTTVPGRQPESLGVAIIGRSVRSGRLKIMPSHPSLRSQRIPLTMPRIEFEASGELILPADLTASDYEEVNSVGELILSKEV